MHTFVRSLITEWRKLELPFAGNTIVIAVSGGADSMSLLLAVDDLIKRKKLSHTVIVAHLNHKLRGRQSDADEKFVRSWAGKLGYEFVSRAAKLPVKGNLEQNAREARYNFLSGIAMSTNAFAVLTAHTLNDQAETFLMNLIRGSGPDGLAAMRPIRYLENGALLVRPLLSWASRENTENFCRDAGVKYRGDAMNRDEKFTRVRIRKTILPKLAEMNPRIVETLARTAGLLQPGNEKKPGETHGYSAPGDDLTGDTGSAGLRVADLTSLSRPQLLDGLREWLRESRGNLRGLQLKHIEAIERLVWSQKSGKTVELPGGGRVVKGSGRVVFKKIKVEK